MQFNSFVSSSTAPPPPPPPNQPLSLPSSGAALPDDDTIDRLGVLFRQEESCYRTTDYLAERNCRLVVTNEEYERQRDHHRCRGREPPRSSASPGECQRECGDNDLLAVWRKASCVWAFEVAKFFELNLEIVSIAMNHLDRYLGTVLSSDAAVTGARSTDAAVPATTDVGNPASAVVSKEGYQLWVLTSLYLAIKLNHGTGYDDRLELPNTRNTLEAISLLSDPDPLSIRDLRDTERDLLRTLEWHVHPPTPHAVVRLLWAPATAGSLLASIDPSPDRHRDGGLLFLRQRPRWWHAKVHKRACAVAVEALQEYESVSFSPSEMAIAALLNAVDFCGFGDGRTKKEARDDDGTTPPAGTSSPSALLLSLWKQLLPAELWYKFDSPSLEACRKHLKQYFEPAPKTATKRRKSACDDPRQETDGDRSAAARRESPQAGKDGWDDPAHNSSPPSTKKARIQRLPSPASSRDLLVFV